MPKVCNDSARHLILGPVRRPSRRQTVEHMAIPSPVRGTRLLKRSTVLPYPSRSSKHWDCKIRTFQNNTQPAECRRMKIGLGKTLTPIWKRPKANYHPTALFPLTQPTFPLLTHPSRQPPAQTPAKPTRCLHTHLRDPHLTSFLLPPPPR